VAQENICKVTHKVRRKMKELREYTGMKKDHENDHGRLRGKIHADND